MASPQIISFYLPIITLVHLTVTGLGNELHGIKPLSRDFVFPSGPDGRKERVQGLVDFFESMKDFEVTNWAMRQQQNVTISLGEAANKLHKQMDGFKLADKCNKYVRLIKKPNIHCVSEVNMLARDAILSNEVFQNDASLIQMITSERTYDALGRMQSILQALESEKEDMKSTFEPAVQRELLECVNYFVYRHQLAVTGVVQFTRKSLSKLPLSSVQSGLTESALRDFRAAIESIKSIEAEEFANKAMQIRKWTEAMSELQTLVSNNHFEIPKLVQDFVTDPRRLERLHSFSEALNKEEEPEMLTTGPEPNGNSMIGRDTSTSGLLELVDNEPLPDRVDDIIMRDKAPESEFVIEDKEPKTTDLPQETIRINRLAINSERLDRAKGAPRKPRPKRSRKKAKPNDDRRPQTIISRL